MANQEIEFQIEIEDIVFGSNHLRFEFAGEYICEKEMLSYGFRKSNLDFISLGFILLNLTLKVLVLVRISIN